MTCNKPESFNDKSWNQHLSWLDPVSNEGKTNRFERRRKNTEHERCSS